MIVYVDIDGTICHLTDSANYEKSLGETRSALAKGESERNLLRKLQTEGWNAKQSRYIINES